MARSIEKMTEPAEDKEDKSAARRAAVLDAAYECFLQYGLVKTSLDDVAKRAKISRPLLYLLFKNKDELFVAAIRDAFQRFIRAARAAADARTGKEEQLIEMYEELLLKPWNRIVKAAAGQEFVRGYRQFFPHLDKEYEKETLKLLLPIFGDKKTAQLFMLCVDGLYSDYPPPTVLRKRVRLLANIFLTGKSSDSIGDSSV